MAAPLEWIASLLGKELRHELGVSKDREESLSGSESPSSSTTQFGALTQPYDDVKRYQYDGSCSHLSPELGSREYLVQIMKFECEEVGAFQARVTDSNCTILALLAPKSLDGYDSIKQGNFKLQSNGILNVLSCTFSIDHNENTASRRVKLLITKCRFKGRSPPTGQIYRDVYNSDDIGDLCEQLINRPSSTALHDNRTPSPDIQQTTSLPEPSRKAANLLKFLDSPKPASHSDPPNDIARARQTPSKDNSATEVDAAMSSTTLPTLKTRVSQVHTHLDLGIMFTKQWVGDFHDVTSDQRELLNRKTAWYKPEPGTSCAHANVPSEFMSQFRKAIGNTTTTILPDDQVAQFSQEACLGNEELNKNVSTISERDASTETAAIQTTSSQSSEEMLLEREQSGQGTSSAEASRIGTKQTRATSSQGSNRERQGSHSSSSLVSSHSVEDSPSADETLPPGRVPFMDLPPNDSDEESKIDSMKQKPFIPHQRSRTPNSSPGVEKDTASLNPQKPPVAQVMNDSLAAASRLFAPSLREYERRTETRFHESESSDMVEQRTSAATPEPTSNLFHSKADDISSSQGIESESLVQVLESPVALNASNNKKSLENPCHADDQTGQRAATVSAELAKHRHSDLNMTATLSAKLEPTDQSHRRPATPDSFTWVNNLKRKQFTVALSPRKEDNLKKPRETILEASSADFDPAQRLHQRRTNYLRNLRRSRHLEAKHVPSASSPKAVEIPLEQHPFPTEKNNDAEKASSRQDMSSHGNLKRVAASSLHASSQTHVSQSTSSLKAEFSKELDSRIVTVEPSDRQTTGIINETPLAQCKPGYLTRNCEKGNDPRPSWFHDRIASNPVLLSANSRQGHKNTTVETSSSFPCSPEQTASILLNDVQIKTAPSEARGTKESINSHTASSSHVKAFSHQQRNAVNRRSLEFDTSQSAFNTPSTASRTQLPMHCSAHSDKGRRSLPWSTPMAPLSSPPSIKVRTSNGNNAVLTQDLKKYGTKSKEIPLEAVSAIESINRAGDNGGDSGDAVEIPWYMDKNTPFREFVRNVADLKSINAQSGSILAQVKDRLDHSGRIAKPRKMEVLDWHL